MTQNEMREILGHFDEKAAESQRHFDEKAAESQRHFDVVAESLKSDIRLIAEGHGLLFEKMDHLETKLDGFIVETRTNFEEVRAAIKFSYAELDRRLTFLESGFKDLSSRMASIESRQSHSPTSRRPSPIAPRPLEPAATNGPVPCRRGDPPRSPAVLQAPQGGRALAPLPASSKALIHCSGQSLPGERPCPCSPKDLSFLHKGRDSHEARPNFH